MESLEHREDPTLAVDRLSRIVNATKELNSTLDLSELARIIMRIVREETGIERGTAFVMSPERDSLTSLVAQDVDEEISVRLGTGIAGTVAQTGETVDIPDAYNDERFDPSFDAKLGFRTRDIYCLPVRNRKGDVVGVLQLLNRSRELTNDDKRFLADISIHVGLAIDNAAMHQHLLEEEKTKQHHKLEREVILIESVQRYRLLLGIFLQRCPVCMGSQVYRYIFGMRESCPACGYYFWKRGRHVLGSALSSGVFTVVAVFLAWVVLRLAVGPPPSDPILMGYLLAISAPLVVWFFRAWRMLWMAVDLYSRPPVESDFDLRKGFLPVQAEGQEIAAGE